MSYDYRRPRRFNLVSFFLLCIVVAAAYLGYKFIPVYWQAKKVDETLDSIKMRGAAFYRMNDDVKRREADTIIQLSVAALHDMDLVDYPEQPIQVWFSPGYDELHARYLVIVQHPFGKQTVMTMERVRDMPR